MLGFIRLLAQSQRKQLALGRLSNFSSALSSSDSGKEITIHWVRKDGSIQVTKGSVGENIMRIAHQYGIELEGACEGVCACSTCHVILESTVYDKLPEPSENEEDMLDQAFGLKATSRLGCQVVVTAELDGMRVQLPAATRNFYVLRRRRMVAWFRNDLRVADNPLINIIAKYNQLQQQHNLGLTCTTDDGSSNSTSIPKYDVDLICLFCIDERYFKPTQHSPHKTGLFRSKFLIESVLNLRDNLKSMLGRSLLITTIPPEMIIPRLCHQSHDLYDVFVQAEVASEEVEIERRVENALRSLSPSLSLSSSPSRVLHRIIGGSTLYHPQDLPFRPDCSDLPNIFSDFRHALEQGPNKISIRPLLPTISADMLPVDVDNVHGCLSTAGTCGIDDDAWSRNHTDAPCSYKFVPTLLDLGFSIDDVEEYDRNEPLRSKGVLTFVGGEDEGLRRLQTWMFQDDRLKDYFDIRNGMLGEAYSSKLSPWLALGCISPRLVYHESKRYENERAIANKSTYWMHFELMVRDFFHYYCKKHGRRVFLKGGVLNSPEAKRWTVDGERIRRWKTGTTGQPLVDANMRELLYTGWMSNRGRQNVASYLVFDLGVDWRVGADHFESYLIDHDVCQNYGNWNSIAGLTVKKLSKFNCVKQSKDYDPEGKYIAHWVPELGSIPVPWRFQPSAMVDQCECDQYQLVLGSDYPTDISGNYDKVLIKLPAKRSVKPTVKGNIKKYFQTQTSSYDVNGAGGSGDAADNGGTAEKDTPPADERTDYRSVWW